MYTNANFILQNVFHVGNIINLPSSLKGNFSVFGWDHGRDISISNGVLGHLELQNEDSITLWL